VTDAPARANQYAAVGPATEAPTMRTRRLDILLEKVVYLKRVSCESRVVNPVGSMCSHGDEPIPTARGGEWRRRSGRQTDTEKRDVYLTYT
jgi:hypothetical protein